MNSFHVAGHKIFSADQLAEFMASFSKDLEREKYIISEDNQNDGNNTISDGYGGTYPVLFEAQKESFSRLSIVRVCEEESKEIFIQFSQSACFNVDPEKHFSEECNIIYNILRSNYPEMTFYGECPKN